MIAPPRQRFYGWYLLVAACFIYGFGITPGYYSWGQFFKALEDEFHYERRDLGLFAGVFTFLYSAVGPLVGWAQKRFSIRAVMTAGALIMSLGYFIVSRADSKLEFFIGFSILGGGGVGLSTIVPCQTLGQYWFLKRRSLAIAIMMASGGLVAPLITNLDEYILAHYSWRDGWVTVMCMSLAVAVVALVFVRDTPEQLGQHRDGLPPDTSVKSLLTARASVADLWTAQQAFRTPQFWLIVIAGTAYAVPWGVVIFHGASHIRAIPGLEDSAGTLMGTLAIISIFGRLSGSLGDWLKPQTVLTVSLVLEGLGCVGFLYTSSYWMGVASFLFIGLGFGAAYVSIPVVFTDFFGRGAFGITSGVRMLITGVFNGLGPYLAGYLFDINKSYAIPFWGLFGVALLGAIAAAIAHNPGAPPSIGPGRPNEAVAKAA
jgi:MFS family permease